MNGGLPQWGDGPYDVSSVQCVAGPQGTVGGVVTIGSGPTCFIEDSFVIPTDLSCRGHASEDARP